MVSLGYLFYFIYIRNHHEKCIQISTNMLDVGLERFCCCCCCCCIDGETNGTESFQKQDTTSHLHNSIDDNGSLMNHAINRFCCC